MLVYYWLCEDNILNCHKKCTLQTDLLFIFIFSSYLNTFIHVTKGSQFTCTQNYITKYPTQYNVITIFDPKIKGGIILYLVFVLFTARVFNYDRHLHKLRRTYITIKRITHNVYLDRYNITPTVSIICSIVLLYTLQICRHTKYNKIQNYNKMILSGFQRTASGQ